VTGGWLETADDSAKMTSALMTPAPTTLPLSGRHETRLAEYMRKAREAAIGNTKRPRCDTARLTKAKAGGVTPSEVHRLPKGAFKCPPEKRSMLNPTKPGASCT